MDAITLEWGQCMLRAIMRRRSLTNMIEPLLPRLTYRNVYNSTAHRLFLSDKDPDSNFEIELRHWYGMTDDPDDYPAFIMQLWEKGERGAGIDWWAIHLDQESTAMLADAFEGMSKGLRNFAEHWEEEYGERSACRPLDRK